MTPEGSDGSFQAAPPPHPLDEKYYVRAEGETLGPYEGRRIKEMVEQGRLSADSPIAKVGATEWSAIRDVPVFASLLPPALPGAIGGPPGSLAVAGVQGGVRYAGFWIRLLAYIIDGIIVEVAVVLVSGIIGFLIGIIAAARGMHETDQISAIAGGIGALIGLAMVVAYYVVFNSGRWQATPGKRVLGLHIITTSGKKVGGWLACGRYFAYIISSLPFCLGFMVIGWNEEKKGFHDMICNTRVIYGKL